MTVQPEPPDDVSRGTAFQAVNHGQDARATTAGRPNVWLVRALCLYAILAVAVSVKTIASPERHTVYPKFAARAIDWWSGGDLYEKHEGLGRFPYSPTFAIFMTPFALLGNRTGAVLWSLLNIVVYVYGLRRLVRDVLPGEWPPHREALFLALAMIGSIRGFWNAQSNALIIGLLMIGLAAVARRRWWRASLLMAGAVYLKVWPIVIPLLVIALWPRRFAWRFSIAAALGAGLPFLTRSPAVVIDHYRDWFAFLSSMSEELVGSYRDAWTVLKLLEVPVPTGGYRVLQLATGLAVLGWCLWIRRRLPSERWLLTFTLGMGTAWLMVFGPAVEYNTYVVLAPAATWALLSAPESGRAGLLAVIGFAVTMVLGSGSIARALADVFPPVLALLPAGTLLLAAWLVYYGAVRCRPVSDS